MTDFDYVIVGAGSAGCVLANRLSRDPSVSVCLLEAGGDHNKLSVQMPMSLHSLMGNRKLNWNYYTTPQSELNGRKVYQPRGKILGGSSSINAMVYIRGHRYDYDEWLRLGNTGWGYEDVLPYFMKSENQERGASEVHGVGGELSVGDLPSPDRATETFVSAAVECGYGETADFNDGTLEGAGIFQVTQRNGQRCSTAVAFLEPVASRKNLTITTGAHCRRILFEGTRAVGVEYSKNGEVKRLLANKEVLLCAGAIGTPQILLLSGVGPKVDLEALSIPVLHDLQGVGKNLQDHVDIGISYLAKSGFGLGLSAAFAPRFLKGCFDYFLRRRRRGPLTSNIVEGGAFLKTDPDLNEVDIQLHFVSGNASHKEDRHSINYGHAISCAACVLRPESRGQLKLSPENPEGPPLIDTNYLGNERDLETLVKGARVAHAILNANAFSPYRKKISLPDREPKSDEDLIEHIRANAATAYHPVGTCKMGPSSDPNAVVSADLRVRGLQNLRVVDASIMPTIVSGNTNAPTIMIGEKASDLILSDLR